MIEVHQDRWSSLSRVGRRPHLHGATVAPLGDKMVAMLGNTNLVEVLLEAGADPNARDPTLNLTVTHDAAREGFVETVRVLVNHGAEVNLADETGNLPLHLAAKGGHLEVVRMLLEITEDPRRTNDLGHTALSLARDFKHEETADFIEQCLGP